MHQRARSHEPRGQLGRLYEIRGFDAIAVQGKSEIPVYLYVHNGEAEIRDAGHTWGKTAGETRETLKKKPGRGVRVATTGPAPARHAPFISQKAILL